MPMLLSFGSTSASRAGGMATRAAGTFAFHVSDMPISRDKPGGTC